MIHRDSDAIGALIGVANTPSVVEVLFPAQTAGYTGEVPVFVAPSGGRIGSPTNIELWHLSLTPDAAITGAGTNIDAFVFNLYTSAGVFVTTLGYTTLDTTTSWGKFQEQVFFPFTVSSVTTSRYDIAPGSIITLAISKTASGVNVPNLLVTVGYTLTPNLLSI